jgi:hypothetical protein
MPDSKQIKEARVRAALGFKDPDQAPISDFYWTGFLEKCKKQYGPGFDVFRHFDLDYVVVNPNMDPHIQDFEVLEDDGKGGLLLKTGFGALIRRKADCPMPEFVEFAVKKPEDMAKFELDSPRDRRRLYKAGDDQINGVGDAIARGLPSWNDRVDSYCKDFPVFGSIDEGMEQLWRCVGSQNALYWMADCPELLVPFVERLGDFLVELVKFQIEEARGRLTGMYIWGDVAYVTGMLFSPAFWREHFKPIVKRIIDECHKAGLVVIYHGDGKVTPILGDYAEIGLDGYNPLECKAGMDAVQVRRDFESGVLPNGPLAVVGNFDVRELESGNRDRIKRHALYKLHCAQHGGWICQSDHSVTSDVAPDDYQYMIDTIREYSRAPMDMARIDRELAELDKKLKK